MHKCKSRNSAYAYPVEMLCTVRDNAPADSPGGKSAVCCARYPGLHTSITTRIRTRLHGTAALTLTHKRRRSMLICTFVVPPRQTIGIDWFGKDAAKGLQRRRARSGRRATRAAAYPTYCRQLGTSTVTESSGSTLTIIKPPSSSRSDATQLVMGLWGLNAMVLAKRRNIDKKKYSEISPLDTRGL